MRGSKKHETRSRVVALLLELVAAEVGLDVESSDSTTFRRENLERGFEPDERFYFGDTAGSVRGMDDVDLDAGTHRRTSFSRRISPAPPWTSSPSSRGSASLRSGATQAGGRRSWAR